MPTRYHLGTQAPATADAAGIMAALAALFAVAADVDTSTSAAGVLTWTRDTTAGSQVIYSSAFGPRNSRIILAVHDSGTPTPSPGMVSSADSYTAANILIGLADNAAGAYAGWNQAAPFSGCTFAGYYRLAPSAGITSIRAMLSSKDLVLQVLNGTTTYAAHAGAVVKAPTGFQESDGFRYGLMVSGAGSDMNANWRSNNNSAGGYLGRNGASNGFAHFGCYGVGVSSWQTMQLGNVPAVTGSVDTHKLDSTTAAKVGIPVIRGAAPFYTVGSWLGVSDAAIGLTGQNISGVGDSAVRLSSSTVTTNEESVAVWRTYS